MENPASVLTDAPVKAIEPSVIPAAAAVVYPFPSTLKVLEFPPALQQNAA